MKSLEEFDKLIEKKLESIQKNMDEIARKKREVNESIADAIIELIAVSLKDFEEYGSKDITHREQVLGDYNTSKGIQSSINVNQEGITIHLFYSFPKDYDLPKETDETLLNNILSPYFIKVTCVGTKPQYNSLVIVYDRAKRLSEQAQHILKEENYKMLIN